MKKHIFLSFLFYLTSFTTFAASIPVPYNLDDYTVNAVCSLREAITNANNDADTFPECIALGGYGDDDTISLVDGETYYLSIQGSGENDGATGDLDILDNLIITSNGTVVIDAADLDAGGSGDPDRIFHFITGDTFEISNITMQEGDLNDNGSSGYQGAAIHSNSADSTLTIDNCTIQNNTVTTTGANQLLGGAIYSESANLIITNSIINNNELSKTIDTTAASPRGGGIFFDGDAATASLTITNSEITGNLSTNDQKLAYGGGVYIDQPLTFTIDNVKFQSNSTTATHASDAVASAFGGAIYITEATEGTISNSLFYLNEALSSSSAAVSARGGAIYSIYSTIEILNTTFNGNVAVGANQSFGGAIENFDDSVTNISFSTFVNNTAGDGGSTGVSIGGALHRGAGTINLISSIFETNSVMSALSASGPSCGTTITSLGFNVFDDDNGCGALHGSDNTSGTPATGMFNVHSTDGLELFPIDETSDAYNFATNCLDANGDAVTTDQRGADRPETNCDAGAFEYQLFYEDSDLDGEGSVFDPGLNYFFTAGYATNNIDCNDSNAAINNSATELCGDGTDNDCDGDTDEGFEDLGAACSEGVGACENTGVYECATDLLSLECSVSAGDASAEVCDDESDNDCDGDTDSDDADCTISGDDDDDDDITDTDGDGIADSADNCPDDSNANQLDSDADGIGNECESTATASIGGCQLSGTSTPKESGLILVLVVAAGWLAMRNRKAVTEM